MFGNNKKVEVIRKPGGAAYVRLLVNGRVQEISGPYYDEYSLLTNRQSMEHASTNS
jgi:hypothetical protein